MTYAEAVEPEAHERQALEASHRMLDARARGAARVQGYVVRKFSCSAQCGGFLIANANNRTVAGSKYELSAQDVLAWLARTGRGDGRREAAHVAPR